METTPEFQASLDSARREGHARGFGLGLFWAAACTALVAACLPTAHVPKFLRFYENVKVMMPALTIHVVEKHVWIGALLVLAAMACGAATYRFHRPRRVAASCAVLLAVSLAWLILVAVVMPLPLEEFGFRIGR